MVIWLVGLSGAGKTTIAEQLLPLLRRAAPPIVSLDGDVIRSLFGASLGYDVGSRVKQIERIRTIAKFLSDQGVSVVVSALYASPKLLAWNRANLGNYFEVFVDTPMSEVAKRDTKGLYGRALQGIEKNVVGMDIEWLAPQNSDLVVYTLEQTPKLIAHAIFDALPPEFLSSKNGE